jgi:hypothetical protein
MADSVRQKRTIPSVNGFLGTIQQMIDRAINGLPVNKIAVIDPAYSSGWPRVTFAGESKLTTRTFPYNKSYTVTASDRVVMIPVGTSYWIVGAIHA